MHYHHTAMSFESEHIHLIASSQKSGSRMECSGLSASGLSMAAVAAAKPGRPQSQLADSANAVGERIRSGMIGVGMRVSVCSKMQSACPGSNASQPPICTMAAARSATDHRQSKSVHYTPL
jgi:hypothetical protein